MYCKDNAHIMQCPRSKHKQSLCKGVTGQGAIMLLEFKVLGTMIVGC